MEGAADSDTPVPERSAADRAAALARLLHRDCTRLLELYVSTTAIIHTPVTALLLLLLLLPITALLKPSRRRSPLFGNAA